MRKFKSTEVIEKERRQLKDDFQVYQRVEKSDDLKSYLTLKEKVESKPFLENKKEIESLRYEGSPEEKLYRRYLKLSKNKKLVLYFEVLESADLKRFQEIVSKKTPDRVEELRAYMKSGKYKQARKEHRRMLKKKETAQKWEETETWQLKRELDELLSSSAYQFYLKFNASREYRNFQKIEDSALLNEFEQIKAEVESERFKERKNYLEDKKRFKKTEDYKILQKFYKLHDDPDIQLYLSYNDTDDFKFYREWQMTFEEEFASLQKDVWAFVTPIGEKGPGRNFSIENQLHYDNNSDNFDFENSILTLETKKEKVEGLYWDKKYGFVPKTFQYASGVAHTLKSFVQKYGYFEAKLKMSRVKGVVSSISLINEGEDCCIRLITSNGNKARGGVVLTDHNQKVFQPVKFKIPPKNYFIVGVYWTPERLRWYLNDTPMGEITTGVPHSPLGLRIETEVLKDTSNLPHRLDVDWIMAYKKN